MSDAVARVLSLTAIDSAQTSKTITTAETVGSIPAGTVIPAGTSVSDIILRMLGEAPPSEIYAYAGAVDNIPTNIDGLTRKTVKTDILSAGYSINIKAGNPNKPEGQRSQYVVFAVPYGYKITKWTVAGLGIDIPHTLVKDGINEYNVYYLNSPSYDVDLGGNDYVITGGEE